MVKQFQRKKEDFVCEACGAKVAGTGYTNHCPACLMSKHVDIFPGDRLEECQGLMEPIALEQKGNGYRITHRCVRCGYEIKNNTSEEDSSEALYALAKTLADKVSK